MRHPHDAVCERLPLDVLLGQSDLQSNSPIPFHTEHHRTFGFLVNLFNTLINIYIIYIYIHMVYIVGVLLIEVHQQWAR